jgi:hypothetical protein
MSNDAEMEVELVKLPPDVSGFRLPLKVGMIGWLLRYERGLAVVRFPCGHIYLDDTMYRILR